MTNKEKAKEIANNAWVGNDSQSQIIRAIGCLTGVQIAEWKDQQFKEYLEKKTEPYIRTNASPQGTYQEGFEDGYTSAIDEIINELFKEG